MYKWLVSRSGSEEKLRIYQKQHAKKERPRWKVFLVIFFAANLNDRGIVTKSHSDLHIKTDFLCRSPTASPLGRVVQSEAT